MKPTRRALLALLTALALPLPALAEGTVHEVQMLNRDPDDKKRTMIFQPDLLKIAPGDTVRFISVDKGHNAVSDKNMWPEGVEGFKSKINQDIEITFDKDGTYGVFCQPHRTMGMVGLILVGDPSANYEEARAAKQRGKAKKVYKEIFERADEMMKSQ